MTLPDLDPASPTIFRDILQAAARVRAARQARTAAVHAARRATEMAARRAATAAHDARVDGRVRDLPVLQVVSRAD